MAPGQTPVPVSGIVQAKAKPDGTLISLPARVVSGCFAGFFYVEEQDRSAAIKVVWPQPVTLGSSVVVTGTLGTAAGERFITAAAVLPGGP